MYPEEIFLIAPPTLINSTEKLCFASEYGIAIFFFLSCRGSHGPLIDFTAVSLLEWGLLKWCYT